MSNNLIPKWIIINSTIAAGFIAAYAYGILDLFIQDNTYMTQGIIVLGTLFIISSFFTTKAINDDFKKVEAIWSINSDIDILVEQWNNRLMFYRLAGPILVTLGLLGTILGVIMAFSGIGPDIINDVAKSSKAIQILLSGLGTAFTTTMWGMIFMLWNMINLHNMVTASSKLYIAVLK